MKFIVVIHVVSTKQTLHNVQIAQWNGADGVFLISHGHAPYEKLLEIYRAVRSRFPFFWIGLNFLDLDAMEAVRHVPICAHALWTDNAWIDETQSPPTVAAEAVWNFRKRKPEWRGLYFGGIAFKYQREVKNLALVTEAALPFMDVVTTSGDATGKAPAREKIATMKRAAGIHPIAIASGITVENAAEFKSLADYALVYSSLSDGKEGLDPMLVRKMSVTLRRMCRI